MEDNRLREVFSRFDLDGGAEVIPFLSEEDGSPYAVWRIGERYVLKKAKGMECEIYGGFFPAPVQGAPRFFGSVHYDGEDWLLMEYCPGENLCRCTRERLIPVLDALISLQNRFWERTELADVGLTYEKSLPGRVRRGECLTEPGQRKAYGAFLSRYAVLPRTLCHDDLLPFNVLSTGDVAVLIDWESGGLLPYPSSLARLIAHGQEDPDFLFTMTEEDKAFAVEYYYQNLVKERGIPREEYLRDIQYFLLYEYCEWLMLDTRADLYRWYEAKVRGVTAALEGRSYEKYADPSI